MSSIDVTQRIRSLGVLVMSMLTVLVPGGVFAASFTVRNSDFVNGVYDFHYYTFPNTAPVSVAKRTVVNGIDQGVSDPTLTKSGWEFGDPFTPNIGYWAATGVFETTQTTGALTMGWDFSPFTGRIAKIEMKARHVLFAFDPWIVHAQGDQIAGFVATPATFGAATYTPIYSLSVVNTTVSSESIMDITSLLPAAWLNDPGLLELKFTYTQTPNPTVPGRHIEIFRDNTGAGIDGFLFRVTLASCTTTASSPGSVASGVAYDVTWNSTGSASYEVQEATRADFSDAVSSTVTVTRKQYQHPVTSPATYYYRVKPIGCGDGDSFGPATQTVVLPQQAPDSREFDLIVPIGSTSKVTQEVRLANLTPGATFSATTDQPYLSVAPQSGTVPASGIVTLTVSGDPKDLQPGANTGTVILTMTSSLAAVTAAATVSVTTPVSVTLVAPVSQTPKAAPPDDALLIPAVAHLEGSGTRLQSDIRLTNANTTERTYQLTFTPSNTDGTTAGRLTTITVQPEQTIALNDVLRNFFGFAQPNDTAGGSLEVRAASGVMGSTFLTSRTYASTSIGTYGQFIPAVPIAKLLKSGGGTLTLTQVSQGNAFRSDIGLVEGLGVGATGRLRVFNLPGQNVKDVPFTLKPFEFQQLNGFLAANGVPMDDARIELVVDSPKGGVSTYASVLDNKTQDPLLVSPVQTASLSANRYVLPGMADFEAPTNFHSDIRIFNPTSNTVGATLTFYPHGSPAASTARQVALLPGETKAYDNVLPALFGLRGVGGSIVVSTASNTALVVSGRTYSNAAAGGAYGQFIPAVTPADGAGAGDAPLQLLQLEQSPNFRSNLGLNELTGNPVTLRISLVVADSKVTSSTTVDLQGNEFRQLNSIINSLGPGKNAYNARVIVRVIGGTGRVTAYASVVDNRSADPTYVPAQK
jgi:hypothetical protein